MNTLRGIAEILRVTLQRIEFDSRVAAQESQPFKADEVQLVEIEKALEKARKLGEDQILFGPVPELKVTVPVVLYLPNQQAADDLIEAVRLCRDSVPGRKMVPHEY
jgi:hypothetical protein